MSEPQDGTLNPLGAGAEDSDDDTHLSMLSGEELRHKQAMMAQASRQRRRIRDRELRKQQQLRRLMRQRRLEQQAKVYHEEEEKRRRAVWGLPEHPHQTVAEMKAKLEEEQKKFEARCHPAFMTGYVQRAIGERENRKSQYRHPAWWGYRADWEKVGKFVDPVTRKPPSSFCCVAVGFLSLDSN